MLAHASDPVKGDEAAEPIVYRSLHVRVRDGEPTATSKKKGKLAPKNKQHLPRREKKALQKATATRIQK